MDCWSLSLDLSLFILLSTTLKCLNGGIGRHSRLRICRSEMVIEVQILLGVRSFYKQLIRSKNEKKSIFLLFSLIAIFFSACSTGDETTEIIINPVGLKSELTVLISEANVQTKSVDYGDNNYVETRIHNAVIGTFFEDGSLNVIRTASFAEGAKSKTTFSLKSGNIKMYVVANVDVDLFSTVSTEAGFKNVVLSLDQNTIPLSANTIVNVKPYVQGDTTKATIYLERIVSKVSLSKVEVKLADNGYPNTTFKVDRVFLHGANTKSTIEYVVSDPKSGLSESSLMNYKADFWGYYDRHYFYAFESNLKLIIGGWFKEGNRVAEYMYFPIPVKAVHNTHHVLTATIKGKGVKNPDDNYESAGKLETTLKVLGWNEKKRRCV